MYEEYWKLDRKPFENTPDPEFFYLSPEHSEALDRFVYLITERKGSELLTGEYGCGKTTMIRVLGKRLDLEQHRLGELFYRTNQEGGHAPVIVDEAQIIPDDDVIEELRPLFNFQLEDTFLVTLLLVGQPELRERVLKLPQLDQRIAVRYHLHNFDLNNTGSYIAFRMEAAGRVDENVVKQVA